MWHVTNYLKSNELQYILHSSVIWTLGGKNQIKAIALEIINWIYTFKSKNSYSMGILETAFLKANKIFPQLLTESKKF